MRAVFYHRVANDKPEEHAAVRAQRDRVGAFLATRSWALMTGPLDVSGESSTSVSARGGPGMRVAIYLRTDPATPHLSPSHEAQEAALRTHIRTRAGWQQVGAYIDQTSKAPLKRPALRRALTDADSGHFDVLLVYRLDRLARSPRQLAQILNRLDGAGVALHSVTEPLQTPAGRLTLDLVRAFAAIDAAATAERARGR
jgi:hypothetical protein